MSKLILLLSLITLSSNAAFAASSKGRVKMTVVRTNVQPADVKVAASSASSNNKTIEVIY